LTVQGHSHLEEVAASCGNRSHWQRSRRPDRRCRSRRTESEGAIMGYKLLPPGTRRNNATYVVRGWIGGRRFEARSDATYREAAEGWAIGFVARLEGSAAAGPAVNFTAAAEAYIALKRPRPDDEKHILLLAKWFANKPLREIVGADL